jgi:HEAT repeat protein
MGLFSLTPLVIASFLSYHIAKGNIPQALETYQKEFSKTHEHDFRHLEEIAFSIIEQGFRSNDPEDHVLALFSAGICQNERFLPLIEELFNKTIPEIQLIALHLLADFQTEKADRVIQKALGSPYLELRMEALHTLASKKDPSTLFQTEALLAKLPPKGAVLFPEIFAFIGTENATKALKKLFVHPDHNVRLNCILSAIQFERDDLLPNLKTLSLQQDTKAQEACSFAFGLFKDTSSKERLKILAKNPNKNISLSALNALHQLGDQEAFQEIEKMAKLHDLFAITLLGSLGEGKETLILLKSSKDLQVRSQAILALLEQGDEACLPDLLDYLLEGTKDFACEPILSQGRVLKAFRVTPSATEQMKDDPLKKELITTFRENLLKKTTHLKEEHFFRLAKTLLDLGDSPLTKTLISLLEAKKNDEAIKLLKTYQQKPGAPLTRGFCTLALCHLKQGDLYKNSLKNWMIQNKEVPLIRFKPLLPKEKQEFLASHHLTPEDTSALLIGSLEWLAKTQDLFAIETLLSFIEKGHEKNKYALAGLLIRSIQ